MENVPTKTTALEYTRDNKSVLQESQTLKTASSGLLLSTHFIDYEESVVIRNQPFTTSTRVLSVYTLDWSSRSDSYFLPVTGLEFLMNVLKVMLLQMTADLKSSDSVFVVKIPNRETLYLGMENSRSLQRALICSQRSFNMSFLDPNKQEAVMFTRKLPLTNFGMFFRQDLVAFMSESDTPMGRIQQDNSLSTVSFTILDDQGKQLYKIVGSESTVLRRLNSDVNFSILDPVDRTGGVILHKWDNHYKDCVSQHIPFRKRSPTT